VDGLFPENAQPDPMLPNYVPQKWIDLVKGVIYQVNDVDLIWSGLTYEKGTYKGSLLADYVYSFWLEGMASYMTGVGDAKANPKGANLVNPTQRYVNTWNKFVKQYQGLCGKEFNNWLYNGLIYNDFNNTPNNEVSLLQFLSDKNEDYPNDSRKVFEVKNQLGL
jgi:hypothetical protein